MLHDRDMELESDLTCAEKAYDSEMALYQALV